MYSVVFETMAKRYRGSPEELMTVFVPFNRVESFALQVEETSQSRVTLPESEAWNGKFSKSDTLDV